MRRNLNIAFLLFALLPFTIAVALVYVTARGAVRDNVATHLTVNAQDEYEALEGWHTRLLEHAHTFSQRPTLRRFLGEFRRDPREELRENIRRIIADARQAADWLGEVSVLDLEGRVIASTATALDGVPHPDLALLSSGRGDFRILIVTGAAGEVRGYAVAPLREAGELIAEGLLEWDVGILRDTVGRHAGWTEGGEAMLFMRPPTGGAVPIAAGGESPGRARGMPPTSVLAALDPATVKPRLIEETDPRGRPVLSAAMYYAPLKLGLVVTRLEEEVYAPLARLRDSLLVLWAFTAAALTLAARRLAGRLARPILALADMATRYAQGDRAVRVPATIARRDDELGTLARLIDRAVDTIAERERSLDAERRRYADLVQNAPDAIVCIDEKQEIVLFNEAAERIFGYRAGEIVGHAVHELLPQHFRLHHPRHVAAFAHSDETTRIMSGRPDLRGLRKNGEEFPVSITVAKQTTAGGLLMTAVVRDVTALRRAEAAVEESEIRLRSILRAMPDTIFVFDAQRRFRDIFTENEDTLYVGSGQALGRTVHEVLPAQAAALVEDAVRRTLESGQIQQFEHPIVLGGGTRWCAARAVRFEREGQPHVLWIARDITAEKELKARLSQVQKMEVIGNLAGGVAHDFNNRLTVILGNLELLKRRLKEDRRNVGLLDAAIDAARSGATLVSRLLTFARRQLHEDTTFDANSALGQMQDMIKRAVGETVAIRLRPASGALAVHVDANEFESAILNVVTNARDAMPAGGILTIATERAQFTEADTAVRPYLVPGEYACVSLEDTGHGMAPEVAERVFEPFFTTKGPGAGTGLGLSQVYGFAKQSGGYVHLYSEPGKGTCVKLYLPLAGEGEAVRGVLRTDPAAALPRGEGRTVLVVEDEAGVRKVAVALLKDLGYRVLEAENGIKALAILLEEQGIDALFTDMVMPGGVDGLELARKVRAWRPALPVVIASGYAGTDLPADFRWLAKPYTQETLARTLAQALPKET